MDKHTRHVAVVKYAILPSRLSKCQFSLVMWVTPAGNNGRWTLRHNPASRGSTQRTSPRPGIIPEIRLRSRQSTLPSSPDHFAFLHKLIDTPRHFRRSEPSTRSPEIREGLNFAHPDRALVAAQTGRELSRPIRACAARADDRGKDEDSGRLAAWAGGLDPSVTTIAGEVAPLPRPPGAEPCRLQGHSFLRLAMIKASRVTGPAVRAGVFNLAACRYISSEPILPASHLRASIRRAERRKSSPFSLAVCRILPDALHPNHMRAIVGDRQNVVDKTVGCAL